MSKTEADLRWLMEAFREVLAETGSADLVSGLPWRSQARALTDRAVQAFAMAFQLLHLVEENAAAQARRLAEEEHGPAYERGLWGQCLAQAKEQGMAEEALVSLLASVRVEPVLTAHPTEAKRATVLEHYRNLYLLLVKRENPMWTSLEREGLRDDVKATLERLWRTGDIFLEKPDVASELRNVIHYLRQVFPSVLTRLDRRLRQIWSRLGYDPERLGGAEHLPRLTFSTWVGGDRDGHPLVTAEVTRGALQELRDQATGLAREQLLELIRRLSLSDQLQRPPQALLDHLEQAATLAGEAGRQALQRNPNEPWRQLVNLMRERVPGGTAPAYHRVRELSCDLECLRQGLEEVGASRLVAADVLPIQRSLQTFGFHLASLDIRQNSQHHDRAVEQLLQAAGCEATEFSSWDEERRRAFLERELASPRPFTRPDQALGPEATATLSCYQVLVEHLRSHGQDGLGALIVSMTRSVSDLLVVYLLAREVGLLESTPQGPRCPLPVVPLFETIEDLERSPDILQAFLEHPITRRSLPEPAVQQVMVGYSDSNKDGGLLASLWGLYRAQGRLAACGRALGVRIRFFHGRGGTISRGAGPTGRFIRALPPEALGGDLRLTEQGETIAQKYANQISAVYNLELLLAGVARASLAQATPGDPGHALEPCLDRLARVSREAYANLLATPDFLTFFSQATPLDVIEQSRIGSRPSRRSGRRSLADLRAIPWVFSWSQARFYLSGWYGVGTALQGCSPQELAALRDHLLSWAPLHYMLSNAATSVMTAEPATMELYADLVEDVSLRERVMSSIRAEYSLTRRMLEELYAGPLESRRSEKAQMLARRQEALQALHRRQIELLRAWRTEESPALLTSLLLSVNAIAAGLGATG